MRLGLLILVLLETDLKNKLGEKNPHQDENLALPGAEEKVQRRSEPFPRCWDTALQPHLLL